MKRRTKIIIGIVVVVIAGAVSAGFVSRRGKDVTAVTFAKVDRADLTSKVSANGRIDAKRKVDLSANVMGQIVNLAVPEGDVVKKDDFLLQIDQKQLAASADGAAASLQALFSDRDATRANAVDAERNYLRAKKNYDERIIPLADFERTRTLLDAARANVVAIERRIDQARANLAAARDTLSKTTMRAPMSGIVTALPVHEGEVAVIGAMNNPGTKLLTIADMSLVEAVMAVDETDVPNVKVGQRATVTIDAYPEQALHRTRHRSRIEPDPGDGWRWRRQHLSGQLRGEDPARKSPSRRAARIFRVSRDRHRRAIQGHRHSHPGARRSRETG
jgi:HlyD family secretion protein